MSEEHQHWYETARLKQWANTMLWQELGENVIRDGFVALRNIGGIEQTSFRQQMINRYGSWENYEAGS